MNFLAFAFLAFTVPVQNLALAGDDRFGVCTHFQQGWPVTLMPSIRALGVGWIRDNYDGTVTNGTFVPAKWIPIAHANGLKIVLILGASNALQLAPVIAKSGQVDAIEIVNEANNVKAFQGQVGEAALVTLTNSVKAAVACQIPVIGLDEQGSEILYMLSLNPSVDGLVYHPYPPDNISPALVYEPPYKVYSDWVNAVRAASNLPIWETEWGFRGSPTGPYTYHLQSTRLLARLALTQSLHIERTFIYEFKDNGTENYGLCDNAGTPKTAYYAVQHFIATLPK